MGIKRFLPFNNCCINCYQLVSTVHNIKMGVQKRATLGIEDISFGHKAMHVSYDELTLPHSRTIFYMHSLKFLLTLLTTKMLCYNSFFQFQVPPTASIVKNIFMTLNRQYLSRVLIWRDKEDCNILPCGKEQWEKFSFALKSYAEV